MLPANAARSPDGGEAYARSRRSSEAPYGAPPGGDGPWRLGSPHDVLSSAPGTVLEELEAADRLLIQQVFKPMANEYRISIPAPGSSEEGAPLLYVKQKRMKIKEDIRFRLSPEGEEHLFMIKSKSVFEFRGRHEVLDADGAVIGLLEKDFTRSLLRSHWRVRNAAGEEILEAHEASWIISIVRTGRGARSGHLLAPRAAAVQLRPPPRRAAGRPLQAGARQVPRSLRARARARDRADRPDGCCSRSRSGWTRFRIASAHSRLWHERCPGNERGAREAPSLRKSAARRA